MAVCHTSMSKPRFGEEDDPSAWREDNMTYQASSPDEVALVVGAKGSGFWFKRRNYKDVVCVVEKQELIYSILNVNEFNSTRKRMSAVVKTPEGKLVLMCKGADSVIYERLKLGAPHREETKLALRDFANEGLRTLVLAEKSLSQEEYDGWNARYVAAFTAQENRDALMDSVAAEIECNLDLIGATAIEDKLQDGVPACIKALRDANIMVWVLTGDKVETAINIAMACNLLDPTMQVERVSLPDPPGVAADDPEFVRKTQEILEKRRESVEEQLNAGLARLESRPNGMEAGLVIDGYALTFALEMERETPACSLLLKIGCQCKSVVCCRVSPKQKADVTETVRIKKGVTTLAIGDGANDVGMILKAHIGVGISGKEGVQAVMASDYAIAQFQYLRQLILVHGRWDVQRISKTILYFFYKNVAFAICQFWFGIYTGFSGVVFWDDWYQSVWNVFFTSLPILAVSLFDKDMVHQATLHHFPQIYKDSQYGQDFTSRRFFWWQVDAVWCSLVVFFVPMWIFHPRPTEEAGMEDGKWMVSYTSFACCHVAANLRLAVCTRTWTPINVFLITLSVLSYWIFSALYTVAFGADFAGPMYKLVTLSWNNGNFWACLFLTQVLALVPSFLHQYLTEVFWPTDSMLIARIERRAMKAVEIARKEASVHGKEIRVNPKDAETDDGSSVSDYRRYEQELKDELLKIWTPPVPEAKVSSPRAAFQMSMGKDGEVMENLGFAFSGGPGQDPAVDLCAGASNPRRRNLQAKANAIIRASRAMNALKLGPGSSVQGPSIPADGLYGCEPEPVFVDYSSNDGTPLT